MKLYITLSIFIAVLTISCGKEAPEAVAPKTELEMKSDELRSLYLDRLPELGGFKIILEDYNAIRDYLVVYGSNDTKIFVAYLDRENKSVRYRRTIDVTKELHGKFQIQNLSPSALGKEENHSAVLYLAQRTDGNLGISAVETKHVGAVILFLENGEIRDVPVLLDASLGSGPHFSDIMFTHRTLYYCLAEKVHLFDKATLRLLYSGPVVESLLEQEPIRAYYFENNRVVVLYKPEPETLVVECGEISDNNFKTLWKHELTDWQPIKGEIKRSDYTFWDDGETIFLDYVSAGERYEDGKLVKYSEEEQYRYHKATGN